MGRKRQQERGPRILTHCRAEMLHIGRVDLARRAHIGFPLEPGVHEIYSCANSECDQVSFIPATPRLRRVR